MVRQTRRRFLKTSGGALALGSVAAGSASAGSTRRFVVAETRLQSEPDLEVIHDLSQVGLTVVRGPESAVGSLEASYAPDTMVSPDLPDAATESRNAIEYPPEGMDLEEYQWDKQDQRIPEAHEITRGEGTRVAIIDGGIGAEHPDLDHAVNHSLSKNFTGDTYGAPGPYAGAHGSHVAGIVAADDQDGLGVVGSAPGTELVDLRVFSPVHWPGLWAWMGDVLAAVTYAADIGADVANLSLGWTFRRRDEGWGRFWGQAMQYTGAYANRQGTVLTHACGNWGGSLQFDKDTKDSSEMAGGLTVSATGPIGFKWGDPGLEQPPYAPAYYTNYGMGAVDIGAPGGNADLDAIGTGVPWYRDLVVSTIAEPTYDEDGTYQGAQYGYDWYAGTSMAAPQVAGAASLVTSANPRYNANQVKQALKRAAEVPEGYGKEYYGAGYLDTLGALTR